MELSLVAAAVLILMDGIKKVFPAVLHSGLKSLKKLRRLISFNFCSVKSSLCHPPGSIHNTSIRSHSTSLKSNFWRWKMFLWDNSEYVFRTVWVIGSRQKLGTLWSLFDGWHPKNLEISSSHSKTLMNGLLSNNFGGGGSTYLYQHQMKYVVTCK